MANWYVYIVRCADDTLYTGITNDLVRRMDEHNNGRLGAAYTRSRRPLKLVYQESHASRSAATRRENSIKQLSRQEKETLLKGN